MFALSVFVWLSGFSAIKTARLLCLLTACLLARFLACSEGNCSVKNCISARTEFLEHFLLPWGNPALVKSLTHMHTCPNVHFACLLALLMTCSLDCLLASLLVHMFSCMLVCLYTFVWVSGFSAIYNVYYTFWPTCRSVCLLIAC